MGKYLLESLPRERSECSGYHHRVFDTGNHPDGTTTCVTGRYIDIEYSLEALHLYALGCMSSRHAALQAIAHHRLSRAWRPCHVLTASPEPDACYWDGPAPRRTHHGSVSDWLSAWALERQAELQLNETRHSSWQVSQRTRRLPIFQSAALQVIFEFSLNVVRQYPVFLGQLLPEHRVTVRHQLIEERLLGPMTLIEKSAGARAGIPCRNDGGHDSLPCDSE